ncbi:hypothetical protein LTR36_010785 [Oleoguttula mirabilis]|uniref:Uncharacterized protein n=1 Tax=Oleoguttula mirabilis TaxID=1507867 RepID=A0AAV9JRL9_9PEZI|nr:hypothetical protein LTR36_010785 [Oleoguttula mirabilis]
MSAIGLLGEAAAGLPENPALGLSDGAATGLPGDSAAALPDDAATGLADAASTNLPDDAATGLPDGAATGLPNDATTGESDDLTVGLSSDAFVGLRDALDRLTRVAKKQNQEMKESLRQMQKYKGLTQHTSTEQTFTEQSSTEQASTEQASAGQIGQVHHLQLPSVMYDSSLSVLVEVSTSLKNWRKAVWSEREKAMHVRLMACTEALRVTWGVELGEEYDAVVREIGVWVGQQRVPEAMAEMQKGV